MPLFISVRPLLSRVNFAFKTAEVVIKSSCLSITSVTLVEGVRALRGLTIVVVIILLGPMNA